MFYLGTYIFDFYVCHIERANRDRVNQGEKEWFQNINIY